MFGKLKTTLETEETRAERQQKVHQEQVERTNNESLSTEAFRVYFKHDIGPERASRGFRNGMQIFITIND